jgi:hypothetical protein
MYDKPLPGPFAFPNLRHNQFAQVPTETEIMATDESDNAAGCNIDKAEPPGGLKRTAQNVRSPVVLPETSFALHERSDRRYVIPCCFSYHLHSLSQRQS